MYGSLFKCALCGAAAVVSFTALARAAPPYDFSSPEAALASAQEAVRAGDRAALVEVFAFPKQATAEAKARKMLAVTEHASWSTMAEIIGGLRIREVDRRVSASVRSDAGASEAVRALCSVGAGREYLGPSGEEAVVAVTLVKLGDSWRWYWGSQAWGDEWRYERSTPEEARRSVLLAKDKDDLVGVADMMDPQLIAGIGRDEFLRIARERVEQVRQWESACRGAPGAGAAAIPPRRRPPFELARMNWAVNGVDVEEFERDGLRLAHVYWKDKDGQRGRDQCETFVKRADKWYWQPKPEYTAWPVGPNAPAATQPAPDAGQPPR